MQYQNPYGYSPYYGGDKDYRKNGYQPYGGAGGEQNDEDGGGRGGGARGAPSMLDRAQRDSGNLKVWIFLNGVEIHPGFEVAVNKKKFPHWINFLDFITENAQSMRYDGKLLVLSSPAGPSITSSPSTDRRSTVSSIWKTGSNMSPRIRCRSRSATTVPGQ